MTNRFKLLLASGLLACLSAAADPIQLPSGMAGVPNIGAIPCHVFTEMLDKGPKGVRLSLLTWAEGYFFARSGETLNEMIETAPKTDEAYDFYGITDRFVEFCAANPDSLTHEAVLAFGGELTTEN